jgi:integrase
MRWSGRGQEEAHRHPPTASQVRAQKPEIITWTGPRLHAFLTWNRDEFDDELFPLWRTIAYTGMRRSSRWRFGGPI